MSNSIPSNSQSSTSTSEYPPGSFPKYDTATMTDWFDWLCSHTDLFDEDQYEAMYRHAAEFLSARHGHVEDASYYWKQMMK